MDKSVPSNQWNEDFERFSPSQILFFSFFEFEVHEKMMLVIHATQQKDSKKWNEQGLDWKERKTDPDFEKERSSHKATKERWEGEAHWIKTDPSLKFKGSKNLVITRLRTQ